MLHFKGWLYAVVIFGTVSMALGQATTAVGGARGAVGRGAAAGGMPGGALGAAGLGRGAAPAAMALNRAFYATELDALSQQLTLTDDQKAKLQDKIDTMNKELDTFLQNAQSQIAAARRGARGAGGAAARGGMGVGGVGGAGGGGLAGNPTVTKLQDDLQLLANEHQVLINQVLTPGQRLDWETYKLHRVLDPRLQSLGLTDDQKDKVKSLVDNTAQALAALAEGKAVQTLQGQLFRKLIADVLTDAQVGKLMEGPLPVQGAAAGRGAAPGGGAGGQ